MNNPKFLICEHCGNIVGVIHDAKVPMMCCGQKMTELKAGSIDASKEKHVPVITVDGNQVTVNVGSAPHPMEEAHHISWVYLQTDKGGHRKELEVNASPELSFALTQDEKPVAAFAYCNLHGLWKADV